MIIDFHTHIFSQDLCENRDNYLNDENFNLLYNNEKSVIISHINLIDSMDNANIDYAVAMGFPWINEKYCEEQNRYLKEVSDLSGNRIIPFASVPLNIKDIEGYIGELKNMGFAGIGEVGFYQDGMSDSNCNILHRILKAAREHSLLVCLHVNEPVGHNYSGKYDPVFSRLYSIISDYEDVNIILAHWGGGLFLYELMNEVKEKFKNFYYDTAASPFLYRDDIYNIAESIVGSEKILFGSDYPLIKFNRYIDSINENISNAKKRENIYKKNAAKLLKIEMK